MKTIEEIKKEFRECLTCKIWKKFIEFNIDRSKSSGLRSNCRDCEKETQKQQREKIKEDPSIYARKLEERRIDQARIRKNNKYKNTGLEYSKRDPKKTQARNTLNDQIKSGYITKLPCQICGDVKSEGHHEDYSKPLDVIWLCRTHHGEIHRKFNTILQQIKQTNK